MLSTSLGYQVVSASSHTKKAKGKVSSHSTWFSRHRPGDVVKPCRAAQQRNKVHVVLLQAVKVDQRLETAGKKVRVLISINFLPDVWLSSSTGFKKQWRPRALDAQELAVQRCDLGAAQNGVAHLQGVGIPVVPQQQAAGPRSY